MPQFPGSYPLTVPGFALHGALRIDPDAADVGSTCWRSCRRRVQGRTALGERAGERDLRVGQGTRHEPFVKGAGTGA